MKWYRTKEADSLKHDIIAIFMREKFYHKDTTYTVKYLEGYYYIILNIKGENIDNILPENEYKEIAPSYLIQQEYNYRKLQGQIIIQELGNYSQISDKFHSEIDRVEILGGFTQRGGIIIHSIKKDRYIKILLNGKSLEKDLYDIKYFKNNKVNIEFKDVSLTQLPNILYR
ncbi:hypothetical protein [Fusobacterium sp. THCT1E2]